MTETDTAQFPCAVCGNVAARVTFVPPFAVDPAFDPEPSGAPPGVGSVAEDRPRLSIQGGPVPGTRSPCDPDDVRPALRSTDAGALYAIDPEFAPFWCPECGEAYCGTHWATEVSFDGPFYDATYGTCPQGHERKLDD